MVVVLHLLLLLRLLLLLLLSLGGRLTARGSRVLGLHAAATLHLL